ncbi:hypothetical protein MMC06_000797 [Schaereria dolodes]|nr:hypothetical protein [Schaereria dolodes]
MGNPLKDEMGKKSRKADMPSSETMSMPPPGYSARPPKGHTSVNEDSEDYKPPQPTRPRSGRSRAAAVSDDELPPPRPRNARPPPTEDNSDEDDAPPARPKKGGRAPRDASVEDNYEDRRPTKSSKGDGRQPKEEEEDYESDRRPPKPSRRKAPRDDYSEEQEEDDRELRPTRHNRLTRYGRRDNSDVEESDSDGRHSQRKDLNRNGSKALTKSSGKSKALAKSRNRQDEGSDSDEETINVSRFKPLSFWNLNPVSIDTIARIFQVDDAQIETWCERGRIKGDRKTGQLSMKKIFELFPSHHQKRWEAECEDLDFLRHQEEHRYRGLGTYEGDT